MLQILLFHISMVTGKCKLSCNVCLITSILIQDSYFPCNANQLVFCMVREFLVCIESDDIHVFLIFILNSLLFNVEKEGWSRDRRPTGSVFNHHATQGKD